MTSWSTAILTLWCECMCIIMYSTLHCSVYIIDALQWVLSRIEITNLKRNYINNAFLLTPFRWFVCNRALFMRIASFQYKIYIIFAFRLIWSEQSSSTEISFWSAFILSMLVQLLKWFDHFWHNVFAISELLWLLQIIRDFLSHFNSTISIPQSIKCNTLQKKQFIHKIYTHSCHVIISIDNWPEAVLILESWDARNL